MRSIFRTSLTLPMLALLAACQTTPTTGTDKAVCLIWTPATYSGKGDTQETIDGNRALNAKRDAYCKK
jgi:hypothetical protein